MDRMPESTNDTPNTDVLVKTKRKHSVKFDGLSEEELGRRHLPDHLVLNMDILIVGLNPTLQSAFKGHHYAGPGHHFWKCIYIAGLVPHQMNASEDYRLPQFGIGFTNVVARATRTASELTKEELQGGTEILTQKVKLYKPKIVAFIGKGVYDLFYTSANFKYGKQSSKFPGSESLIFVIPSSTGSGSSHWPRVQDKLPFFEALRKLRDFVKGDLKILNDNEIVFPISVSSSALRNVNIHKQEMKSDPAAFECKTSPATRSTPHCSNIFDANSFSETPTNSIDEQVQLLAMSILNQHRNSSKSFLVPPKVDTFAPELSLLTSVPDAVKVNSRSRKQSSSFHKRHADKINEINSLPSVDGADVSGHMAENLPCHGSLHNSNPLFFSDNSKITLMTTPRTTEFVGSKSLRTPVMVRPPQSAISITHERKDRNAIHNNSQNNFVIFEWYQYKLDNEEPKFPKLYFLDDETDDYVCQPTIRKLIPIKDL